MLKMILYTFGLILIIGLGVSFFQNSYRVLENSHHLTIIKGSTDFAKKISIHSLKSTTVDSHSDKIKKRGSNDETIPTYIDLKNQFQRLDDEEIKKSIKRITKVIEDKRFIDKANSGQLTANEFMAFEKLMREKESLYLVQSDRLISLYDENQKDNL